MGQALVKHKRKFYKKRPHMERRISPLSGNRDDIINFIYETHLVENYSALLLELDKEDELYKDYVGDIWLQICEIKQERWDKIYMQGAPAITAFISGLIYRNCKSINSPAYWHLKRPDLNVIHLDSDDWNILDEEGELGYKITAEEQNPWRDKERNRNEHNRRRGTETDD